MASLLRTKHYGKCFKEFQMDWTSIGHGSKPIVVTQETWKRTFWPIKLRPSRFRNR